MQTHELVQLDERFIEWLADRDSREDIDRSLRDGSRYLLVSETRNNEHMAIGDVDLEAIRKHIVDITADESGWRPVALFDLQERKELKFRARITAELVGDK